MIMFASHGFPIGFCLLSFCMTCIMSCQFFLVPLPNQDVENPKTTASPTNSVHTTSPSHTIIAEGKKSELTNFQVFENKLAEKKAGQDKSEKEIKAKLNLTL
ncbi:hypothetical protein LOD99_14862 [Oopsacas minuta]|uniref:Uncharacterized protein n=1 Tax=Oopsacas minuta TaxID=111878 RepID=A0AAV7KD94_9METZ|nr:hypothetical protein LOD99_14862 [Oopsacas minuta]